MRNNLAKPLPTTARLSLGRTAAAVSTREQLQFQLDHALARDAVHAPLDVDMLVQGLQARKLEAVVVHSAVESAQKDRRAYLRRPDLGRKLSDESVDRLKNASLREDAKVLFILADGLSSLAVERHALPLLDATLGLLPAFCSLIPVVQDGRVAIADDIGLILRAQLTVLLIGERPGLSSPDSLGVYLTWNPHLGRTDAERNCISNIRGDHGLSYDEAGYRIAHYVAEAGRLRATGIALKDPAQSRIGG